MSFGKACLLTLLVAIPLALAVAFVLHYLRLMF